MSGSSEYTSYLHAIHNEGVCIELNKNPDNKDWVITVAFYSAMHYLRHLIFPLDFFYSGQKHTASSFDEYCILTNNVKGKHSVLRKLVEQHTPTPIAGAYNNMLDATWTARYNKYQFSDKIADNCRNRLESIKIYCLKHKPISPPSIPTIKK